ncbi:CFEM domain-containing protein [Colletotrichum falcatum]|nr:CFEM domain-containing protein [Colletotrichum falcatum]
MTATRIIYALLALLLGLSSVVQALEPLDLTALPSCGLKCVLQELSLSNCASTNQTCLCADHVYIDQVETCVRANCTVKESLIVKNQTDSGCGLYPAEPSNVILYVRAFTLIFPTLPLLMRIANKWMKISPWGWDDTTIVVAYALLLVFTPLGFVSEHDGAGRDIWTLTPENISRVLLVFYALSICYMTCLAAIKASILFLYLRIFPDEGFRRILWYTQLINLLAFVAYTTTTVFLCQPISYFWTGWAKETEGRCINLNAFAEGNGAFNVIMDVWMLILPLSQVYNLNMKLKKKLGVMLMFGIGIILTAVSVYRLYVVEGYAKSYNVTAGSFETSIWSIIELGVGVFVACLPSARGAWRDLFPKVLQITHLSSKSTKSAAKSAESSRETQIGRFSGNGGRRAASNEESSISELVGEDSNKILMHDLAQLDPVVTAQSETSISPKNSTRQTVVDRIKRFSMQPRPEPNAYEDGQSKV